MVLKGNIYTIEITDVSTSGEGIGRAESMVVFVPGTVPGDTADVEIAEVKKNIARGRVAELVRPSADRTEPLCPYFGRCGGCTLQNMTYEAQLRLKEKQLRDKLERIYGGEAPAPEPIIGMEDPWQYRNKGQYAVYAGAALVNKDGSVRNTERPRVGFYDGRERNIVECRSCSIQSPAAERAADALREYIRQTGLSVYDEKTRKGRLRQMIVRTGHASREVMVTLIVNGRKLPKTDLLTDLMFQAIDSLNDEIEERLKKAAEEQGLDSYADVETEENWYELKSLVINHNSNRTLKEISTDLEVVYGSNIITDESAGLSFEISPLSFYQVNPSQMEKLYDTVLEFADLKGNETVFDLYCGVGTIGLYCAQKAKYVWGIESVKSAVVDANRNAVINGLVNIQFISGKAEEKIVPLIEKLRAEEEESSDGKKGDSPADIVIVDPPRAGCKPELLRAVMEAAPEKIIYVSCDPGTLMRDLNYLTGRKLFESGMEKTERERSTGNHPGQDNSVSAASEADMLGEPRPSGEDEKPAVYEIRRIRQVDQFCHSTHVETVCLLSKLNTKQHIEINLDMDELDLTDAESKATYEEIKKYVLEKHGLKVSSLYISQIKRKCGLEVGESYNKPKSEDARVPQCPPEKEAAIMDALKHFNMI